MAITNANLENFDELTKEGLSMAYFYNDSTWGPCIAFGQTLESFIFDMPFVHVIKVNTTTQRELSKRFAVRSIPTLVFMKDGEEVRRNVGAMTIDELKSTLGELFY